MQNPGDRIPETSCCIAYLLSCEECTACKKRPCNCCRELFSEKEEEEEEEQELKEKKEKQWLEEKKEKQRWNDIEKKWKQEEIRKRQKEQTEVKNNKRQKKQKVEEEQKTVQQMIQEACELQQKSANGGVRRTSRRLQEQREVEEFENYFSRWSCS